MLVTVVEFRITCDDPTAVDLRHAATAFVEAQGWPRDQVSVWDNRTGDVVVTVPDDLLHPPESDPHRQPAHTRTARHTACEQLKQHPEVADSLRHVPFAELRSEVEPFQLAGWSVVDLVHALSYARDGTRWPTGAEYHAEGTSWLQHRLRDWRTAEGGVRPSVSQEEAALRVVHRAGVSSDSIMAEGATGAGSVTGRATPARPEQVRAAADDARRLIQARYRTTSNTLEHQQRTAARIRRTE
ncbi:hypothetical protein RIF23_11865 [Lipingzhangella sp. LS1_29]|uniref:Lsr2 protein n=1 Tax=Lipingzhangella rawalii TaxID=2055835 RepID=A0ABU2H834_9ACTN|nr:hypothetical protein [Lipingzhangella rawalii]MDS1270995.1 hypothetical protein [Lipingzhangella rawalii]